MSDLEPFRHKTFEQMRHTTESGGEYWSARELFPILEYSRREKFEPVIKKAILSCENSGQCSEDHFHRTVKMAHIGIGKQIETIDYHISRYGRIKSFFKKESNRIKDEITQKITFFLQNYG